MSRHLSAPRGKSPLRDLWAVAREPSHLRAFGFTTALMFAAFTVVPFLSPYLTFNAGVAESRLDLIYLAGGLATLFTGPAMGWLADRFGHARVFKITAVVSIVPIVAVTNLPPVGLPLVLTATTLMMVLGSGRMISATALVTGVVLPARPRELHEPQRRRAAGRRRARRIRGRADDRPRAGRPDGGLRAGGRARHRRPTCSRCGSYAACAR
jgi:predicted MFS family arabinose efflux permease